MALLQVHGLEKWYGKRKVVDGVSFEVNSGEVVGLLGPNGAGKTTSFRMATGQIVPNGGTVIFDNQEVTEFPMYRRARLGMGYLSQEQSIFRKLSVEKNLLAILEALPRSRKLGRKLTSSERWERAEEALQRFNLLHVRKNIAARCSGGEKRRLEIARCLVCEPQLILLDEPFAAVDPKTTEDIRKNIRDLAASGIGILLTDHNVREVVKTADRIYLIVEGKVVCHGTPDKLIRDRVAIDAYLGTTFEDDLLMARLAGFQNQNSGNGVANIPTNGVKGEGPVSTTTHSNTIVSEKPREITANSPPAWPPAPPTWQPSAVSEPMRAKKKPNTPNTEPVRKEEVRRTIPTAMTVSTLAPPPIAPPPPAPVIPPAFAQSGSSAKLSGAAQAVLEQELMRRAVESVKDRTKMPDAWHELASRGERAIPVLLEALERRDLEIRHFAFRLLESITGEQLEFQSDASDESRLRQVAHLRAKFEKLK